VKTQSRGVFADAKEENEEKKGGGKKTGMGSKAKGFVQIDDEGEGKKKQKEKIVIYAYVFICPVCAQKRHICAQKSSGRPAAVRRTSARLLLLKRFLLLIRLLPNNLLVEMFA